MMVILPWPPSELSPNARCHWAKKAKAAKSYRAIGAWSAVGGTPGRTVVITFNPPDRRPRDLDNMLASIKSGLDGIASSIGIDDSQWSLTIRKGGPIQGGLVTVEVTA